MKKTAAIFFLAIYLFNTVGYACVLDLLAQRSERRFLLKIDNHDYHEADLVELQVPFQVPYFQGRGGEEYVRGSIEFDGMHYDYVKRRFAHDTLYVYCLPNQELTNLAQGKINLAADNDQGQRHQGKSALTDLSKTRTGVDHHVVAIAPDPVVPVPLLQITFGDNAPLISSFCISLPERPPCLLA